jgi:hypothetical protein
MGGTALPPIWVEVAVAVAPVAAVAVAGSGSSGSGSNNISVVSKSSRGSVNSNSFLENLANMFTPNDGAKYAGGQLVDASTLESISPGGKTSKGNTISGFANSMSNDNTWGPSPSDRTFTPAQLGALTTRKHFQRESGQYNYTIRWCEIRRRQPNRTVNWAIPNGRWLCYQ